MCSWCYAFQPVWKKISAGLPGAIERISILGGLAPDDDEPMPEPLQHNIQQHWQRIQQVVPGTEFNFDFWTRCRPRRATYPACRAVIAAARQEAEEEMIRALQRAYYREARNPSEYSTHLELAAELQLDSKRFEYDLTSGETESALRRQLDFTRSLGVRGFPSLVLSRDETMEALPIDYNDAGPVLERVVS